MGLDLTSWLFKASIGNRIDSMDSLSTFLFPIATWLIEQLESESGNEEFLGSQILVFCCFPSGEICETFHNVLKVSSVSRFK